MEDVVNILYYVIENVLELVKFFLVDKYIFGWKLRKWNWKWIVLAMCGVWAIALFFFYLSQQINPLIFYFVFLLIETFISFEEVAWKLVCFTITEMYAINVIDVMIQQMYDVFFELLGNDIDLQMDWIVSVTTILFLYRKFRFFKQKKKTYVRRTCVR